MHHSGFRLDARQIEVVMIRVLIADDSPTARALLVEILSSDPEIQVVGEACNGVEAVEMTQRIRPDVVTMDIRMPRMDGFEATKEIMITAPTPILIVTSSVVIENVETSMHTLRAGALAVLAKPAGPEAPGFEEAAQQLLVNVKSLSQVKVVRHWRPPDERVRTRPPGNQRVRVVAMATSTGGPAALHRILSDVPGEFPIPILIVQHITQGFCAGLADWLNKEGNVHVKVARDGEPLKGHTAYLAPDDQHLGVSSDGSILLSQSPPVGGFRPSGTFLFESVAKVFGPAALAVILTGMGEDGVAGLSAVRQAGGRILAQDEKSSVVFGMPGAAVHHGLPDQVLPLEAMAPRLVELVTSP
jgi:two-component system chemotaxis response regulator CheB